MPSGVLKTSQPIIYGPSVDGSGNPRGGKHLIGNGPFSTIIQKLGSFDLVQMNGRVANAAGSHHHSFCSLRDVSLNGANFSGRLVDTAYADNILLRSIDMHSNNGPGIDTTETWDSHFDDIVCDTVSGAAQPSIWIRTSRATSGFGVSTDTTNVIRLTNIRCESWGAGALNIERGPSAGAGVPNQIWIDKFKAESYMASASAITYASVNAVHLKDFYVFIGALANGSTAVDAISIPGAGISCSLRDGHIGNGSSATINHGVYIWCGAPVTVDNVNGSYGAAPTGGSHVDIEGGGPYYLGNIPVNPAGITTPVHVATGVTVHYAYP